MAVANRAAGTWTEITGTAAVTIPGTAVSGDRMYLLAAWKDFSVTASVSGWTELTQFADGSTGSGNGTGSMKVGCWYKTHSGSESNPTLTLSGSVIGGACIVVFSKASTELWDAPLFVTAAITDWTNSARTVSASSTVDVPSGGVVIGLVGLRDDSAAFSRSPTTGIDVASGITWNGNYIETPITHLSTTTGNDASMDAGHRLVTTGGTVTLRQTATISASETGAALWVVQGVSPFTTVNGSFTADAILKKNIPSSVTADAVLKSTIVGSGLASSPVIYDDFSTVTTVDGRLPDTFDNSQTWQDSVGDFQIDASGLASAVSTVGNHIAVIESLSSDAAIETSTPDHVNGGHGLVWRKSSGNNYWRAYVSATGFLIVQRVIAAAASTFYNASVGATTGKITVIVKGDNHSIYFDDSLVTSFNDSFNQTATLHGPYFSSNTDGHWSYFSITPFVVGFTADAVLAAGAGGSGSFTADAILKRTEAATFTANSVLKSTIAGSFTADAVLRTVIPATFTADAVLFVSTTTVGGTLTANAILRRTEAATATADSILRATVPVTLTANAVLRATLASTFSADAILKGTVPATLAANAVLKGTVPSTFSADSIIRRNEASSFTADAVLVTTAQGSFTADAYFKSIVSASVSADAVLKKSIAATFTADAYLTIHTDATLTADAVLKAAIAASFSSDAVLLRVENQSFTADSVLLSQLQLTFTADAALRRIEAQAFTADAEFTIVGRVEWTTPGDSVEIAAENQAFGFTVPQAPRDISFIIEFDKVSTFDGVDLIRYESYLDQTGWEYNDGSVWQPMPSSGVPTAYIGNEARFTIPALDGGVWYRRIRGAI